MVGPYADATTLLAGGYNDLPGTDAGWETYHKRSPQTVSITDDDQSHLGDVTVLPGSVLRVFRQNDGRLYNTDAEVAISECSDDVEDLQAPVGAGETVYFEFDLYVDGSADDFNFGLCIHTPPNPTGGFHVIGNSVLGTYSGGAFGADDFNTSSGVIMAQIPDQTLSSAVAVKARGVLANGPQPGLLKLQLGPAHENVASNWTVAQWVQSSGTIYIRNFIVTQYHFYLIWVGGNTAYADVSSSADVTVTELLDVGPIFPSANHGAGSHFVKFYSVVGDGSGDGTFTITNTDGHGTEYIGVGADDGLPETPVQLEETDDSVYYAGGPETTLTTNLSTTETSHDPVDTMMIGTDTGSDGFHGTDVNAIYIGGFPHADILWKGDGSADFGWTTTTVVEYTLAGVGLLLGQP